MKKLITYFAIVTTCLVMFGCASGPDPVVRESLQGEWSQVNGSSIITIGKRDWTIVDMERGLSGFGYYNFASESQINLKWTCILALYRTTRFNSVFPTRRFQKEDLEEYHRRYPERLENLRKELKAEGTDEADYSFEGNRFVDFVVSDNVLKLTMEGQKLTYPDDDITIVLEAIQGEFLKTSESTSYHEGNRER